jgi:hypothetical protein
MQREVGRVRFSNIRVYLDSDCGGRADGRPNLEISDGGVLNEFRVALLEAQYDGDDLRWFGPDAAYNMAGDGHFMAVTLQYATDAQGAEKDLMIHVHGCRFSFDKYGFSQDSFQSARLAHLVKSRLLPPTASDSVVKALDYLTRGVLNNREWSREMP